MYKKGSSRKRKRSKKKQKISPQIIGFVIVISIIVLGIFFHQPIIRLINNTGIGDGNNLGNKPFVPDYSNNSNNVNDGNNDNNTLIEYSLGDLGPAGGSIFYDKGHYSDGWRYLEADTDDLVSPTTSHGLFWGDIIIETSIEIGAGYDNTLIIVNAWEDSYRDGSRFAAVLAHNSTKGGYNDWFLPSKDELILMYENRHSIGHFHGRYYSSSQYNQFFVWTVYFLGGEVTYAPKENIDHLSFGRAIRRF